MTASDQTFLQITQKSLCQGSQLLKLSTFAAVGLLSAQAVMAQTETGAEGLALPPIEPAVVEIPAAQPAAPIAPVAPPAPTVVTPAPAFAPVIEAPVTPSSIVPSSIETPSAGPEADYGTVFIQPDESPTLDSLLEPSRSEQTPSVEVIAPTDYGAGLIDTTDYGVGATMPSGAIANDSALPNVVISERASGCAFSVEAGAPIANAACRQVERLATAITNGIAPAGVSTVNPITIPGLSAGATTAASRDYYNQAAQAVVQLQLGEKFIFPLSMPASLTSLFGMRMHPIFGAQRFHSGTDLGAPMGTPVVATQSGRVDASDYFGGYGFIVILRHNNDSLESRYAHLSQLLVRAGEWVEQGEVIGLVGSTGNSTGPHLHFELRQLTASGWVVLNPDSLLRQTLGTLVQALGNSLVALADTAPTLKVSTNEAATAAAAAAVPLEGLPFRPAQPHAN